MVLLLTSLLGIIGGFAVACAAAMIVRRRPGPEDTELAEIVARSPDALLHFGPDLRCTFASAAATRLIGWPMHGLIGAQLASLFPADAAEAVADATGRALGGWDGAEVHVRSVSATGDQAWIELRLSRAGDDGLVASLRDISIRKTAELALRVANTELNRLAGSDALTGLANRRRFEQMLEGACRRASRQSTPVSLLLIDVDAHEPSGRRSVPGDLCLQRVAGAIRDVLGSSFDAAARFAGEEFAVMLPGRDNTAALVEADRIRDAVVAAGCTPGLARAGSSLVAASVGCATVRPSPDRPPAAVAMSLIAHANRALDRARPLGRAASPAALAKPAAAAGWRGAA